MVKLAATARPGSMSPLFMRTLESRIRGSMAPSATVQLPASKPKINWGDTYDPNFNRAPSSPVQKASPQPVAPPQHATLQASASRPNTAYAPPASPGANMTAPAPTAPKPTYDPIWDTNRQRLHAGSMKSHYSIYPEQRPEHIARVQRNAALVQKYKTDSASDMSRLNPAQQQQVLTQLGSWGQQKDPRMERWAQQHRSSHLRRPGLFGRRLFS